MTFIITQYLEKSLSQGRHCPFTVRGELRSDMGGGGGGGGGGVWRGEEGMWGGGG